MTYSAIEKKIHSVPEEYLDEVSAFIEYILYKADRKNNAAEKNDNTAYFGVIKHSVDGLEVQRIFRDEWN